MDDYEIIELDSNELGEFDALAVCIAVDDGDDDPM